MYVKGFIHVALSLYTSVQFSMDSPNKKVQFTSKQVNL